MVGNPLEPIGFWSYARDDDLLTEGRLSRLRDKVFAELQTHFGRQKIEIFQDRGAISHGEKWEAKIRDAIERATFFIPIVTPGFLESDWCCREISLFLERERALCERFPDLPQVSRIFPIQYLPTAGVAAADPEVGALLRGHQSLDFTELRHDDFDNRAVRSEIAQFAKSILKLLRPEPLDAKAKAVSDPVVPVPSISAPQPQPVPDPASAPPVPVPHDRLRVATKRVERIPPLVERLMNFGHHPVLIFGARGSGKSELFLSILRELRRLPDHAVWHGQSLFDERQLHATEIHDRSLTLFNRCTDQGFTLNDPIVDQSELPFLIPLEIESANGMRVRLALIEGLDREITIGSLNQETGALYPDLSDEISDLIRFYPEGMSVLWLAPPRLRGEGIYDDMTLTGAISRYRELRYDGSDDSHLVMLTKWDLMASPVDDDPRFSAPEPAMIQDILQRDYPNFWPHFNGVLRIWDSPRNFMQYSSAYIVNGLSRVPPQRHIETFKRYPRTLINWMYGNASETVARSMFSSRQALYPELEKRRK
ncbi:toll/interleukin-1 receptor domain-containing protein [Sphingomonas sp. AOB5]|uniref:toll/interleukin-1 receptor domain-containing protein n=1 Tax=Sphingomonas sp. AOB5 TaxID=3034017 RepID=UPI0023F65CD2|nr:toll/interleukin-1 receptor domain-containing protein [Sphingomonas sp. AOB5]MDF7775669.1 toll/interleukin-1 receptor domain-containing protein [Sphingomonas sp. AOB5]